MHIGEHTVTCLEAFFFPSDPALLHIYHLFFLHEQNLKSTMWPVREGGGRRTREGSGRGICPYDMRSLDYGKDFLVRSKMESQD